MSLMTGDSQTCIHEIIIMIRSGNKFPDRINNGPRSSKMEPGIFYIKWQCYPAGFRPGISLFVFNVPEKPDIWQIIVEYPAY